MYDQLLYSHNETTYFCGECKEKIHADKLAWAGRATKEAKTCSHPSLVMAHSKIAFHLSDLAGPSFSELVVVRMPLLMEWSRSVLPLRSAKARELGELWREKCTRVAVDLAILKKLARTGQTRRANGKRLHETTLTLYVSRYLIY